MCMLLSRVGSGSGAGVLCGRRPVLRLRWFRRIGAIGGPSVAAVLGDISTG